LTENTVVADEESATVNEEDDVPTQEPEQKVSVTEESVTTTRIESMPGWADAPEFIPRGHVESVKKTYAQAVGPPSVETEVFSYCVEPSLDLLCPYAMAGVCPYIEQCTYLHGDYCDLCGNYCLHPTDQLQRRRHNEDCIRQHEKDMEISFAIARSMGKACGICMDTVIEKTPASERRFGILANCNHVFCLSCIRKWRSGRQFDTQIVRSCPECRIASDFVVPSKYWMETSEEKDKLIGDYKKALSLKPCKYFKQGRGECPFGGKCFYLHASPDGSKVDLPSPRPRRRFNANGDLERLQRIVMWDFIESDEDYRWLLNLELEEMLRLLDASDSDSHVSDDA
jgi:E3 ubiquitin-protein ligase makorin